MTKKYMEMAFTDAVRELQTENGSADHYSAERIGSPQEDNFGEDEIDFIQRCDSFYMTSINANGWPYIQHRGGPAGFLKVTGPKTMIMPEFPGNRQYLTLGNLSENNRTSLFLMDYPRKARLKIFARSKLIRLADNKQAAEAIKHSAINFDAQYALEFELEAFDWNCPKYITPRYTEDDIRAVTSKMTSRIAELETQLAELKSSIQEHEAN